MKRTISKKILSSLLVMVLTITMAVGNVQLAKADDGGPSQNQYCVDFVKSGSADIKVNGKSIDPNEMQSFVQGTEIAFTLTKSDGTACTEAVIEIEVFDNDPSDGSSQPSIKSIGDGVSQEENVYKYTPDSDMPFIVHVWWNAIESARFDIEIRDGFEEADESRVNVSYKVGDGEGDYISVLGDYGFYHFERLAAENTTDKIHLKIESGSKKSFWKFESGDDRSSTNWLENKDKCSVDDEHGSLEFSDTLANLAEKGFFVAGMYYPNSGRPGIVDEAKKYLYVYGKLSDDMTEDEVKTALASELYDRFIQIDMFGEFGLDRDPGRKEDAITNLAGRIEITPSSDISVKDKNNDSVTIKKRTATVRWGMNEENGNPITSTLNVYEVPNNQSMLICTDFNNSTGAGSTFYLRDTKQDEVDFSADGRADKAFLVLDNFSNVAIGAYGAVSDEIDKTPNYITYQIGTRSDRSNLGIEFGGTVRVMKSSGNFVKIGESGETKEVDGLNANGYQSDTVCETGSGREYRVYVGNDTVSLSSLNTASTGLGAANATITDVAVKNANMADGVTITPNGSGWDVKFKSNFYDSVPLTITYDGGVKKDLTIQRIGLVVKYKFLMVPEGEDRDADSTGYINYDCYGPGNNGPEFKYNYQSGEQIMIYATYYHPTKDSVGNNLKLIVTYGDGTEQVFDKTNSHFISTDGYRAGGSGVATTSFIIDFIPAFRNQDPIDGTWLDHITSTNYKRGFHALVVNDGYDDADSFGGAQIGNGLGVYWDGNINWGF